VAIEGSDFVLPTVESGGFTSLATSATELLNQVNNIPFTQIGADLKSILGGVNEATTSPEMRQTLKDISTTVANANELLRHLDLGVTPAAQQLPNLTAELRRTMTNSNRLLLSLDNAYGNNTTFDRDLERLLRQTNEAMSSLSALADLLARHPEALIRGRSGRGME
jgi:paraquat-inducible protein B